MSSPNANPRPLAAHGYALARSQRPTFLSTWWLTWRVSILTSLSVLFLLVGGVWYLMLSKGLEKGSSRDNVVNASRVERIAPPEHLRREGVKAIVVTNGPATSRNLSKAMHNYTEQLPTCLAVLGAGGIFGVFATWAMLKNRQRLGLGPIARKLNRKQNCAFQFPLKIGSNA